MDFGTWLTLNGLSIRKAARVLGVGTATLHRIVAEGESPNLRNSARIVRGTGGQVDFEDLMSEEERAELPRYDEKLVTEAQRGRRLYGARRRYLSASDDAA